MLSNYQQYSVTVKLSEFEKIAKEEQEIERCRSAISLFFVDFTFNANKKNVKKLLR